MKRALLSAAVMSAAMLSTAQAQTFGTATTDVNIRSGPGPEHPVIGMIRDRQRATVLGCIEGSRWCRVDFRGRLGWAYSQYMMLTGQLAAVIPAPEVEIDVSPTPVVAAPVVTYSRPAPVVTYQQPVVTYPAPVATYQAPAPVVTYPAPPPVVTYQTAPSVTYQAPAPVVAYQTAPAVTYPAPAPTVTYREPRTTTVVATTGVAPREIAGTLSSPREIVYASTTPPRAYRPPRSVRTYVMNNPLDAVYLEGSLAVGAGIPENIDLSVVPNSRYRYAYVNDYPVLVDPATRRIVYVYR